MKCQYGTSSIGSGEGRYGGVGEQSG